MWLAMPCMSKRSMVGTLRHVMFAVAIRSEGRGIVLQHPSLRAYRA